jgi:hypothetical protein
MSQAPFDLGQRVRVMQILAVALVLGVVVFAGIVFVTGALNQPPQGGFLSFFGGGVAAVMIVLHFVVPGIMANNAAQESSAASDEDRWCGMYQVKLIIGMAMLEGAAFLNLVACMAEHNWWSMAVTGALVLLMLLQFPTRTRVEQWIETQRMNNP